jgi:hypothetical protein
MRRLFFSGGLSERKTRWWVIGEALATQLGRAEERTWDMDDDDATAVGTTR